MKRLILVLAISSVLVVSFAMFASAFTMSEKVVVADQLIAIARVPAGGFSADQRIDQVNQRLAYILGYNALNPRNIQAVRMGDERAIMVGKQLLFTVTRQDAKANNTTVANLTSVWLKAARLALPESRPNANLPG